VGHGGRRLTAERLGTPGTRVRARGPPRLLPAKVARARAARGPRAVGEVGRRALWPDGLAGGTGDSLQIGGPLVLAGHRAGLIESRARLGEFRGSLQEVGGRFAVARVVAHCRTAGQLRSGQQLGRRELVGSVPARRALAGARPGDPREEPIRLWKAAESQ